MRKFVIGKLYKLRECINIYAVHCPWKEEEDKIILEEGIFFYIGQRNFLLTLPSKEISKIVKFHKWSTAMTKPKKYFRRLTKTG